MDSRIVAAAECKHNPFVQTAQDRDMMLTHHKV